MTQEADSVLMLLSEGALSSESLESSNILFLPVKLDN
jgi:hypothetical protein